MRRPWWWWICPWEAVLRLDEAESEHAELTQQERSRMRWLERKVERQRHALSAAQARTFHYKSMYHAMCRKFNAARRQTNNA